MISRSYDEIKHLIESFLKKEFSIKSELIWSKPPSIELGDISFPLFNIAKELKISPSELGEKIIAEISFPNVIEEVNLQGGFLNLAFNRSIFVTQVLQTILEQTKYGKSASLSSERIIVEHTSSNPTGPLHIGNFRGSVLGDVLGRLFSFLGAVVNIRYYVNDLGRQIAPLVIGYFLLKEAKIEIEGKGDLWLGKVYASMNTFLEIQQLKKKLDMLGWKSQEIVSLYSLDDSDLQTIPDFLESLPQTNKEKNNTSKWFTKLARVQSSLVERIPKTYKKLHKLTFSEIENLESMTNQYVKNYQEGADKSVVEKFREVTKMALVGHVETLNLFEIYHDDFDWESDVAWSGEIQTMLAELEDKKYLRHDGKARLLINDTIAE